MRSVTKTILYLLFIVPFVLSGCMGEGDLNCDELGDEVTIRFMHDVNPSGIDLLPEYVDAIDLYVFSGDNTLQSVHHLGKEELAENNYTYTLKLPTDLYTFVAWMNVCDDYKMSGSENFATGTLALLGNENNEISSKTPDLFYGRDKIQTTWHPVQSTINMVNNTNQVKVEAAFDRRLPTGAEIKGTITGRNTVCNFTNRCPVEDTELHTYLPHSNEITRAVLDSRTSYYTVQRLWTEDDLELTVFLSTPGETDTPIAVLPLTKTLMQNPAFANDANLEKFNDYHIYIQFEYRWGAWVIGKVEVNGWSKVDLNEILK